MILVEEIEVMNFKGALRGMRNPIESWDKSDSEDCVDRFLRTGKVDCSNCAVCGKTVCGQFLVGKNDMSLMRKLYKGGTEHRKYLRQIFVCMDITAPLYWWKEFDTYKVGVTGDSCSTMHTLHKRPLTLEDFSREHLLEGNTKAGGSRYALSYVIDTINYYRERYEVNPRNKELWYQMIQLLPSSYNQKRTETLNYENVMNIIKQRTGHKLSEWRAFVDILRDLPYIEEIME